MSVLQKIACMQGRKDEMLNQELAKELANNSDSNGIKEIVGNLWNKDKNIQSDCIKVLYEIGYIRPELIGGYVSDFIKLLNSKNNRLVWGGMIALATIAKIKHQEIFKHFDEIKEMIQNGSVLTVDNGIKILATIAPVNEKHNDNIFPYLVNFLKNCRPKSIAQYAESIFIALTEDNKSQFMDTVNKRKAILNASQLKRVEKLLKKL